MLTAKDGKNWAFLDAFPSPSAATLHGARRRRAAGPGDDGNGAARAPRDGTEPDGDAAGGDVGKMLDRVARAAKGKEGDGPAVGSFFDRRRLSHHIIGGWGGGRRGGALADPAAAVRATRRWAASAAGAS